MRPIDQVVPVIATNDSGGIQHFLGTGCFVLPGPVLVTAEHVIRDWSGALAIGHMDHLDRYFPAQVVKRDRRTDLAVLSVDGYVPPAPITVGRPQDVIPNRQVACFEYGTTTQGGGRIVLSPATRLGNVTRQIDLSDLYGDAGKGALELSFPALRGASGAPVLSNQNYELWGIVIANAEYHMLPVQIESVILSDRGEREERKYMLPQGIAVNVSHVRTILGLDP